MIPATAEHPARLNPIERCLRLFAPIQAGEGRAVGWFALYGGLIVGSFFLFKALREPLLLAHNGAIAKAYASAIAAVLLFALMPVYTFLFGRLSHLTLLRMLALLFAATGLAFIPAHLAGWWIGYTYYVWIAIYGVAMVAHFWAFAATAFNMQAGQRLFPLILLGTTIGGIGGAQLAIHLLDPLGIAGLLGLAAVLLAATALLPDIVLASTPPSARGESVRPPAPRERRPFRGIAMVLGNSYLGMIAAYVVVLNVVNTTGEYLLARSVLEHVMELTSNVEEQQQWIAHYYARFIFWTASLGLVLQAFLVSRLYQRVGPCATVFIPPLLTVFGYLMIGILPVFGLLYLYKIIDNGVDTSIMNTTRQALFLPVSYAEKFTGKTTIDTLFWRLGDLVQALIVHLGVRQFGWEIREFALFNLALGIIWVFLAFGVVRCYRLRLAAHKAVGNVDAPA